jgi:hypothetical protein
MILGLGLRTAIELEMRLRDAQALERRLALKRQDDPTDRFVLVIADTRTNRRILREPRDLFADLPRLRPSGVLRALAAGRHPPTGLMLLQAPSRLRAPHGLPAGAPEDGEHAVSVSSILRG